MTNIQKLQFWLDGEVKNGLVDFKFTTQSMLDGFFPNGNIAPIIFDPEAVAGELLEMIHAPSIPDPELF